MDTAYDNMLISPNTSYLQALNVITVIIHVLCMK